MKNTGKNKNTKNKKYKSIFDLKSASLLAVILLLLIATAVNILFTPKMIETINSPEIAYTKQQTEGEILPLNINVLLDASGSGWKSVLEEGLLENITAPFKNFSEQPHKIMFNSFSASMQNKSSSVFVDTSDEAALEELIAVYKEMYQSNGSDVAYSQMVSDGIAKSDKDASEKGRKNVLILITRSPDFNSVTSKNADNVKAMLEEYDASLYCIGLQSYDYTSASTYKSMELLTESGKIFEEVNMNFVSDIISQIVRKEAYTTLLKGTDIIIEPDNSDNLIHDLKIYMYSGSKTTGFLQKVIVNNANETSYVKLSDINISNESVTLSFDKDDLKDMSVPYTFKLVWDGAFDDVYYKITYSMYSETYNQASDADDTVSKIAVYILSSLLLAATLVLVVRLLRRLKNRSQAQMIVKKSEYTPVTLGETDRFAVIYIFIEYGKRKQGEFYRIYDCNDSSLPLTDGRCADGNYYLNSIIKGMLSEPGDQNLNIDITVFYQDGKLYYAEGNSRPKELVETKRKYNDYTIRIERMQ